MSILKTVSSALGNKHARELLFQILLGLFIIFGLVEIFYNTVHNLEERGIITSISFFYDVAPFGISFSPFLDYDLGNSTYWDVFVIGVLNTILVSVLGIILATILGFVVGVARLSNNFLIAKVAGFYVEVLRNIPLLLQIMFWYFAILLPLLPDYQNSIAAGDWLFLNKNALNTISLESAGTTTSVFIALFVAAFIALFIFRKWAKARQDRTGYSLPVNWISFIALILWGIIWFLILDPFIVEYPTEGRFGFENGSEVPLPLLSLLFTLTTYTAAFIAENVRSGIQAVSKQQREAAAALGLHPNQALRLVIIPQAMRVLIPPTINQYLNLTKNSSLAVAISYEEIISLFAGITLNNTGQALIIMAITVGVYQVLSGVTSLFMNWYNNRVQLVRR